MAEDDTETEADKAPSGEHKTESTIHDTGTTKAAAKSGGNVLTHKLGPLPVWGWFAVGLGMYLLYRHFKGNTTTQVPIGTVSAGTGALVGGNGVTDTGTGTSTNPQTGADWISKAYQALQNLGYDNNTINNALQKYASGQPLNPTEYGIVEAAIKLIGAAPSALGNPTQAPSGGPTPNPNPTPGPGPAGGPPNLSPSLITAMQTNGEHLVSTVYDPTYNEWLYLTQKGGVYALNSQGGTSGTSFFGSLFSLPANVFADRTASQLIVSPDGGYTVVDTAGETYKFNRTGTGANYAANPSGA